MQQQQENKKRWYMSKQSINFKKRTYDEIFLSLLIDGYKEGLLSTDANFLEYIQNDEDVENILILDYSIIAYQLSIFYDDAEKIYQSKDLDLAVGIDLDNIGKEKGISRPSATYPETVLTFYRKTSGDSPIIIPKGTRVGNYSSDSPIYRTLETVEIPATANNNSGFTIDGHSYPYVNVNSRCEVSGYNGRVDSKELTEVIDNFTGRDNVYCVNVKGSSGGRGAFDDDKYRDLLRKWASVFQRGNLNCYVDYLERVDGLDSYYLIPRWNYPGTVKIVVDPPTKELINRVEGDCESSVGLCKEVVTVVGAKEVDIEVYCMVNVDIDSPVDYTTLEKEGIAEDVKQAIFEYVNGYNDNLEGVHYSGLTIGEDFIPYWCGIYVASRISNVKDVSFLDAGNPVESGESGVVYHPANNTPIGDEEIATISLENIHVTVQ